MRATQDPLYAADVSECVRLVSEPCRLTSVRWIAFFDEPRSTDFHNCPRLDEHRRHDDEENDQLRLLTGTHMLDIAIAKLSDAHFMGVMLASVGCAATVVMALLPLIQTDNLSRRIRAVSSERERIRLRERERLAVAQNKTQLRHKSGGIAKRISEALNLNKWLGIEHAVRRVSLEIGSESIALAEELSLLAAEMSYLEQRRTAFENFNARTGIESIRQLTTVLVQSEKYGTPLGGALRVLAQESRDQRMTAAEKKAASLPPTLTVPMIIFFLPGLFAAILGPAAIQINHWT